MPSSEKDASPLNVANGYLYAMTSGYYGDAHRTMGTSCGISASGKKAVFNSLCNRDRNLPDRRAARSVRGFGRAAVRWSIPIRR